MAHPPSPPVLCIYTHVHTQDSEHFGRRPNVVFRKSPPTVEEMPPRRMGSIRVVVVFSSRFIFFSGGPEPPSPAARLLLRPDIAAVAEGQLRVLRGWQAGGGGTSVACRKQRAKLWVRLELRCPESTPWTYLPDPAPGGRGSALTVGSTKCHHLGFHRTSLAARRTAQASERLRMWRNLFPVSIGGSWFRLSSLLVPPLQPRDGLYFS